MTQGEIDQKVWEWCEFKWSPGESHLTQCRPGPFARCQVCVDRACLFYAAWEHIEYNMPYYTMIRHILEAYERKTGRRILVAGEDL